MQNLAHSRSPLLIALAALTTIAPMTAGCVSTHYTTRLGERIEHPNEDDPVVKREMEAWKYRMQPTGLPACIVLWINPFAASGDWIPQSAFRAAVDTAMADLQATPVCQRLCRLTETRLKQDLDCTTVCNSPGNALRYSDRLDRLDASRGNTYLTFWMTAMRVPVCQ